MAMNTPVPRGNPVDAKVFVLNALENDVADPVTVYVAVARAALIRVGVAGIAGAVSVPVALVSV